MCKWESKSRRTRQPKHLNCGFKSKGSKKLLFLTERGGRARSVDNLLVRHSVAGELARPCQAACLTFAGRHRPQKTHGRLYLVCRGLKAAGIKTWSLLGFGPCGRLAEAGIQAGSHASAFTQGRNMYLSCQKGSSWACWRHLASDKVLVKSVYSDFILELL